MIDTHRDLITGSLEIYLSVISNRLNAGMKVLTVVTAIFASLAVITGIYGMNFQHAYPSVDSPRLRRHAARHGRTTAIVFFRRQGWL